MRRCCAVFGWVFIWLTAFATSAFAHAYLDYTEPPLGSVMDEAPSQFNLYFTESVDPTFGHFSLVDDAGELLVELQPSFHDENHHVRIDFTGTLGDGVHRIAWEIMSSVDGHVTRGVIPFSIGEEAEDVEVHQHGGVAESPKLLRVVARWLSYLSMLVLIGSLFFTLLLSVKLRNTDPMPSKDWSRLIWGSLALFFIAETIDVLMQASAVRADVIHLLTDSQWGMARLGKLLFAGSIGLLSILPFTDPLRVWGSRVAGLLMILVHAGASHNAGMMGAEGFLLDAVHLMAAALWLGGLVQLGMIHLAPARADSDGSRLIGMIETLSRFSQMALVSVGLLIASGLLTITSHIPTWAALFDSLYGQALLGKVALLVVLIAIATANRLHFLPRLRRSMKDVGATLKQIRGLVRVEVLLLVAVLFFAGVMTTTSPPHDHGKENVAKSPLVLTQQLESVTIDLAIMPPIEGERTIEVRAVNSDGTPIEDVLRIWLNMTYLEEDLGGVEINPILEPTESPGLYSVTGHYLNLEGKWEVAVNVRIRGQADDLVADFEVSIR